MKKYLAYFSDYPTQPLEIEASTLASARDVANSYRKLWNLDCKLISLVEKEMNYDN